MRPLANGQRGRDLMENKGIYLFLCGRDREPRTCSRAGGANSDHDEPPASDQSMSPPEHALRSAPPRLHRRRIAWRVLSAELEGVDQLGKKELLVVCTVARGVGCARFLVLAVDAPVKARFASGCEVVGDQVVECGGEGVLVL